MHKPFFCEKVTGFRPATFSPKNTDYIVCPAPSVFLCCFISFCLGFLLRVVFFSFLAIPPGSPAAPPLPWFLTLWKVKGEDGPEIAKIHDGKNIVKTKNGQNSIWGPDIFKYAQGLLRSFQMSTSLVLSCSFSISVLPTVCHFYLGVCSVGPLSFERTQLSVWCACQVPQERCVSWKYAPSNKYAACVELDVRPSDPKQRR